MHVVGPPQWQMNTSEKHYHHQIFSQRKFFGKSSDPTTIYGASGVPGATLDVLSPFIFVQDKCC